MARLLSGPITHKYTQIRFVEIANHREVHFSIRPLCEVVAIALGSLELGRCRGFCRPDEEVEEMLLSAVHERGSGSSINKIQSPTQQRKAGFTEIANGRSEVELAIEPWLDGVLVGRGHVREVSGHQRADMARGELRDEAIVVTPRLNLESKEGHRSQNCRYPAEMLEPRSSRLRMRLAFRCCDLAETGSHALSQPCRLGKSQRIVLQGTTECGELAQRAEALRAIGNMLVDLQRICCIQFAVVMRVDELLDVLTIHGRLSRCG